MDTISSKEIITESLEILGVLPEGDDPSQEQIKSSFRTLSMIVKAWQTEGINIWAVDNLEIPIVEGKEVYSIGPSADVDVSYRPVRITHGVYRNPTGPNASDIPLNNWSREEYWRLSQKSTKGVPLNVYLHRLKDKADLYVWPTGSGVEDEKLVLQLQRSLSSGADENENVDFPAEYFLALSWWLAMTLSPKYGVTSAHYQKVQQQAMLYKSDAESYNREDTSVYLEPDPYAMSYWYNH